MYLHGVNMVLKMSHFEVFFLKMVVTCCNYLCRNFKLTFTRKRYLVKNPSAYLDGRAKGKLMYEPENV